MSVRPGQPERLAALIETSNQLAIDRAIVPDLRYREDDLSRNRGHEAIVHGRVPTRLACSATPGSAAPPATTNSSPPWTKLRLGGGFCSRKAPERGDLG